MPPGWWFKPEYIINELNINAAITSPAHDEVVALRPQPYTVRGYAYTGAPPAPVRPRLPWRGDLQNQVACWHTAHRQLARGRASPGLLVAVTVGSKMRRRTDVPSLLAVVIPVTC